MLDIVTAPGTYISWNMKFPLYAKHLVRFLFNFNECTGEHCHDETLYPLTQSACKQFKRFIL